MFTGVFGGNGRVGYRLLLTGSFLPLAPACGGLIDQMSSNANAGTASSTDSAASGGSGGSSFGSGKGGSSFGSGSSGSSLGSGRGGSSFGSGNGHLAGYSSCSWDVPGDVATVCDTPRSRHDYRAIVLTFTPTNSQQEYLLTLKLPMEFYQGGGSVEVPRLVPHSAEVSVGVGRAVDVEGVFEYLVKCPEAVLQSNWTNFEVTVSFTCGPNMPVVSVTGPCGWGGIDH